MLYRLGRNASSVWDDDLGLGVIPLHMSFGCLAQATATDAV